MAAKKKAENEVAAKEEQLPIPFEDFESAGGDGFEDTDKDAFGIPFIRILQSNSPQVNEDEDAYVEGAKAGMFFNTVSGRLYGKEIQVIPCKYSRSFIEWLPDRGGFVQDHGADPSILARTKRENGKDTLLNGNVVNDTRNIFSLVICEDGNLDAGIISFTSTNIKHSKKWMSKMKALLLPTKKPAPMFAGIWKVGTVLNKNDQGTWYGVGDKTSTAIDFVGWISTVQFQKVKDFREMLTSGDVKVDYDSDVEAGKPMEDEQF